MKYATGKYAHADILILTSIIQVWIMSMLRILPVYDLQAVQGGTFVISFILLSIQGCTDKPNSLKLLDVLNTYTGYVFLSSIKL